MSNTKKEYNKAIAKRNKYKNNYSSLFSMLFHNSVKVLNDDIPKRYLLKILLNMGGIAYDKETGLYLPYEGVGVDAYGLPTQYHLIGSNGLYYCRKPEEIVCLRANDLKYPNSLFFEQQAERIADLDMSIEQNLEGVKTMTLATVENEKQLLTLVDITKCRRVGSTVVFVAKNAVSGIEFKTQSTGAEYLVDKMLEARRQLLDETFSHIGISIANTDKRERVQGVEVMASQGLAKDVLSTLVETFNYDAEQGGIPIRLEKNTSLAKQENNEETNKERGDNEE